MMPDKVLITSDCGHDLIDHVLDLIIESNSNEGFDKIRIIVPDIDLMEQMKVQLLDRPDIYGIPDDLFTTVRGFLQIENPNWRIISRGFSRMILKFVLSAESSNLQRESWMPGFRRRLEKLYDEFLAHQSEQREQLFIELLSRKDFPISESFIQKIIDSFHEYEKEVERRGFRLIDSSLYDEKVSREADYSDSTVIFTGFEKYESSDIELINFIAQSAGKTVVTMPCVVNRENRNECENRKSFDEMGFTVQSIGHDPAELPKTEIFIFENSVKEAEFIAGKCAELIESGTKPEEILVVHPNVFREFHRLEMAFGELNIPMKVTVPVSMSEISPVRDIMAILFLLDCDTDRGLSVVSSRFASEVASFVESLGVRNLKKFLKGDNIEIPGSRKTSEKLRNLLALASGVKNFDDFKKLINKVIDTLLHLPESIPYDPDKTSSQSLSTFRNLIKDIENLYSDDSSDSRFDRTYESFLAELSEQVGSSLIRSRDKRKSVVELTDLPHAINKKADVLFLCGMNDFNFPKSASVDPILGESVREDLSQKGFQVETSGSALETELRRLDLVIRTTKENVIITAPLVDDRGEELLISTAILDLFPETKPARVKSGISGFFVWDDLINEIACESDEMTDSDLMVELANNLRSHYPRGERALREKHPVKYKMNPECVVQAGIIGKAYSASGLERYETCPFVYFCEKLLKIPGAQTSSERIFTPLLRGIAIHEYLSKRIARQQSDADFMEILLNLGCDFDEMDFSEESILDDYIHMTELFIEAEFERIRLGNRAIQQTEFPFGLEGKPYIEIEFESGSRKFSGRIDRIDSLPDGTSILIDYKTSSRAVKVLFDNALKYQLPLYALAAGSLGMEISNLEIVNLSRKNWSDYSLNKKGTDETRVMNLADEGKSRIFELIKSIESGLFNAEPSESSSCGYDQCGFYHVCRIEW
jgi:hypothetical protein